MGVDTPLQNVTGPPQANYFNIIHYDVSNRGDGVADVLLSVWWRAALKDGQAIVPVRDMGPHEFFGEALRALCADADARTQAYKARGVDAGAAYALGQRDAIYAALVAARRFSL